jgi:peptide/nickel transport system substrate-binding protein
MHRGSLWHSRYLLVLFIAIFCYACSQAETPKTRSLTILLPEDILSIDPNKEFETITDSVLFNVYESLVGLDEDLHLQPVLAESWENPTPEEWRFHLRKNVRFHDGTPLNSTAVRDALLHVKSSAELDTATFLTSADQIRIVDEHTISIITEKPFAILYKLPFIYITKPQSRGGFPNLVGTGPFRLIQWSPNKYVTLAYWDQYYGTKPDFKNVRYVPVVNISERYEHLKKHQADIMYGMPAEWAMQKDTGIKIVQRPGITVYYLGFDVSETKRTPFRDLRVRQAVQMALNRHEIVKHGLLGFGTIATQPVAPFVFGYDPALKEPEHNMERAKALLAESGYSNGLQTRLDFSNPRERAATLIEQQLKSLGIELQLHPLQKNAFYDLLEAGGSDLFLAGWDCTSGDASEFYEFCLHSPTQGFGVGNYTHYSDPEIDEIVQTNTSVRDERKRREMLQKAAAITMRDLPVIPLYIENDIYAARDYIEFEPRADSEIELKDVHYKPGH